MGNNKGIKKLAVRMLAKYDISVIDVKALKCMITGEGYTVIRFSSIGTNDETERLLKALYLDDRIAYEDSFTYNDRERRIVFIRKDISDDEFLYLLSVELGRILTFKTECDGVIGISAFEEQCAHEFAYHMCDFASHGIVYNFFKSNLLQGIVASIAAVITFSLVICFFIVKGCADERMLFKDDTVPDMPVNSAIITGAAVNTDTEVSETETVGAVNTSSFFATKSGSKYHMEDCGYIAGKDIISVSSKDIQSGKYLPCSRCIG